MMSPWVLVTARCAACARSGGNGGPSAGPVLFGQSYAPGDLIVLRGGVWITRREGQVWGCGGAAVSPAHGAVCLLVVLVVLLLVLVGGLVVVLFVVEAEIIVERGEVIVLVILEGTRLQRAIDEVDHDEGHECEDDDEHQRAKGRLGVGIALGSLLLGDGGDGRGVSTGTGGGGGDSTLKARGLLAEVGEGGALIHGARLHGVQLAGQLLVLLHQA